MSDISYEYFGDELSYYINIDYDYIHTLITHQLKMSKDISIDDANQIVQKLFNGKDDFRTQINDAIESEFKKIIKRKEVKDA